MRNRITFSDFKTALGSYLIVSTTDIYKSFPDFDKRRLFEWCQKKLLKNIIKGFYIFADTPVSEESLFLIANKIYEPSYVSLQSALSWYSLIPEYTPKITSVSTKKTTTLSSHFGLCSYNSLKSQVFSGYILKSIGQTNHQFKMASPEKAILDLLYLNPSIKNTSQFEELRINTEVFKQIVNKQKIYDLLQFFNNRNLEKRVNILLRSIYA